MNNLPKMQRKVYQRLCEFQEHNGRAPELSALARELNIHYVSLRQHLEALHRKGFLVFESRGRGQSPRLELPLCATGVPVLGRIPAGPLSEAFSEAEGYLPLGNATEHFALRVSGQSMADLIQDGDIVLFRKGQPERNGQICAVRVGESDVTLKYLDIGEGGTVTLRPHNSSYDLVQVDAAEVVIEGVYLGLVRGQLIGALYHEA